MDPSERTYAVAPVAADQENVALGPVNVLPGVGLLIADGVFAPVVTEIAVLFAVRLTVELSARVAVRVSLEVAVGTVRPLNVADPAVKLVDVVPVSVVGLPDTDTELLAAAANTPLSVNCTTGAGESATFKITVEGGSVLKASA